MDFAHNFASYYKGEWLEAVLLVAFGVTLTVLVLMMWQQLDQNALLKGLFYPLAFLAIFAVAAGGYQVHSNAQRLASMPTEYAKNQTAFIQAEHTRFESPQGVNAWWLPLKLLWAGLVVAGLVMSFSTRNDLVHGIAIGLLIIGAMGFLIDGFAHNRAKAYTEVLRSQTAIAQ